MDDRGGQSVRSAHKKQPVGQAYRQLGNYRILRLIGQGAFADVYLGEHVHLHTEAAIKVLQMRLVESNIQSFLNEARTIAHLVHPYIIRVLDFGVEANTPFLVMDYAPQGTFRQHFLQGKPLPSTALFPFIKQAASALQYAHDKKLIHRDVKPENMLLGPNKEVLLSDFGFALIQTSLPRTSSETAGTASYMAPEQLQGRPQPASDQYSLGVIAYEWLAGTCPFQGTFMEIASQHMFAQPPSLMQRVPGLSAQVAQVVMTALEKEPDKRFPTVRDFARALEHACLSSNKTFSASSPVVPPPFLDGAESSRAGINRVGISREEASSVSMVQSQDNKKPRPIPDSQYQQPDEADALVPSSQAAPVLQSGSSSFSAVSMKGPSLPPEQTLSSSFGALRAEQSLPPLSLPGLVPFSPGKSDSVQYRSLSHLPALPELPSLPYEPFLAPELAQQAPGASKTFPALQNTTVRARPQSLDRVPALNAASLSQPDLAVSNEQRSPSSASNQASTSQSTPVVKREDFGKVSKSSTSRTLYFFVIFMVALIIGGTAILTLLANNQKNVLTNTSGNQQQPPTYANATTTVATQTPGATATSQTEPNPYGNHNGVLVLNSPLDQQDQQMQWSELPGICSFTDGSYHVVASKQSPGFTLCNAQAADYADFAYQVQMTFAKAENVGSSGGLVFRGNKASNQFYFFEIFTAGNYDLYRCPGANGDPCPLLSSSANPIPSFRTGLNQPNTIAITMSGNTFDIYVNDRLAISQVTDAIGEPAYSNGTIGMMARQVDPNAVTDVFFNDLKIWKF